MYANVKLNYDYFYSHDATQSSSDWPEVTDYNIWLPLITQHKTSIKVKVV